MDKQLDIINLKFGLAQLSGNRTLLIKLMGKFRSEYLDLSERLANMDLSQDSNYYKNAIHTVKGVSGNLGLDALHLAAKELEIKGINQQHVEPEFNHFNRVLAETLSQIQSLAAEQEPEQEIKSSLQSADTRAKAQLTDTLKRNEFITSEKLNVVLEECQFTDLQKQQIGEAISDLDYAEAMRLMQATS